MKRSLIAAILAILVVSSGGLVRADQVIWDNTGTASGLSVITVFNTAGTGNKSECADDFVLAAPTTVTRITPQYFFGAQFSIDHWNIHIYDDAAGVPGTELLSTTAPGAIYVASPPDQVLSLTLAQPFDADASTRYWISLQAAFDQTQGLGVRWREIVAADPSSLHGNVGYWRGSPPFGGLVGDWTWEPVGQKNGVPTTAEMLFTLYGVPVPEPSSFLALAGFLPGLLFLRRRK